MLILRQHTTVVRRSKTFERIVKTTLQLERDEEKIHSMKKQLRPHFHQKKDT
jgi:hypothetical protein